MLIGRLPVHGVGVKHHGGRRRKGQPRAYTQANDISVDVVDAWYTTTVNAPSFLGAISVKVLEGKGRGVVATRPIQPGELLMAVEPIAIVRGTEQQMPAPDELSAAIASASSTEKHAYWLSMLYDGTDKATRQLPVLQLVDSANPTSTITATGPANQRDLPHMPPASTDPPARKRPRSSAATGSMGFKSSTATATSSSKTKASGTAGRADASRRRRIQQLVAYNCFGERRADLAVAAVSGEPAVGFIGLWPEFSLLNHSCAPNTSNWVHRDKMLVRAVRPITQGEEVTISYLGRPQLAPIDVRRQALRDTYGFTCDCARCQVELDSYEVFGEICDAAHRECEQQLEAAVAAAQEAGDTEALEDARDALRSHVLTLNAVFRTRVVPPQARLWAQASMYVCMELLRDSQRALGEDWTHTGLACLRAVEATSPGADLHAILAAQHAQHAVAEHGEGSVQAEAAWKLCRRAHEMRYGQVSEALMRRLAHENAMLHV